MMRRHVLAYLLLTGLVSQFLTAQEVSPYIFEPDSVSVSYGNAVRVSGCSDFIAIYADRMWILSDGIWNELVFTEWRREEDEGRQVIRGAVDSGGLPCYVRISYMPDHMDIDLIYEGRRIRYRQTYAADTKLRKG